MLGKVKVPQQYAGQFVKYKQCGNEYTQPQEKKQVRIIFVVQ
jgi:hypothetical protein